VVLLQVNCANQLPIAYNMASRERATLHPSYRSKLNQLVVEFIYKN
jgi:hypothetical protein